MLKNGKSRTYRKTGRKVNYRRKTAVKTMPKVNKKVVQKMIKTEIAKNVENKITGNISTSNSVLSIDTNAMGNISQFNYFVFNPVNSGVLTINQGVDVQSRIGNQIKLKRYVIKGSVYYDPATDVNHNIWSGQNQGYIDLYIGRPVNLDNVITNQLTGLYQNGNADITPQCQILDRTYKINKDYYKIYWHKRFKIGNAGVQGVIANNNGQINNNDYKLNVEFGVDLCKLACKNRVVKYNDNSTIPQDSLLDSFCLFAVGTYPNYDIPLTGYAPNSQLYLPVRIQCTSYCEFEDA